MKVLGILLIIAGSLIAIISGLSSIGSYVATKDESNWNSFLEEYKGKSDAKPIPDDVLFTMISKLKCWMMICCLLNLFVVCLGISLICCA